MSKAASQSRTWRKNLFDAFSVSLASDVSKREIVMPEGPLHSIGNVTVEIHVHSDVTVNLQVEIVPVK